MDGTAFNRFKRPDRTARRLRRMVRLAAGFAFATLAPATAAWAVGEDIAAPGLEIELVSAGMTVTPLPGMGRESSEFIETAPTADEFGTVVEELGIGNASWYGKRFAGRPTASGETFDPGELTAAHRSLPFGSMVRVTSQRTGQSITVRINDRGPFHGNRVIDLSEAAADAIGLKARGHDSVALTLLQD